MDIIVTISDAQWQQFQEVAKDAVEATWNGSYENFAIYIMGVNIKKYIESQQKKHEKQRKRALEPIRLTRRTEKQSRHRRNGEKPSNWPGFCPNEPANGESDSSTNEPAPRPTFVL